MIPFSKPYLARNTEHYLSRVLRSGKMSGNGLFTKKCNDFLKDITGSSEVLITHSCTGALEMAILLACIKPGDEVIMPSFTFSSTANAVLMRGGIPIFVDVSGKNLNLSSVDIAPAITEKTKAILVMHYAGFACEMDSILKLAEEYDLVLIEDAAQSISASFNDKALGTFGHFGCFSFHDTKNIHCGQGGAILIRDKENIDRARMVWEKGTNRDKLITGKVNKYEWCELGSSYLPSEIAAAILYAQLEELDNITSWRRKLWDRYHNQLKDLDLSGFIKRPIKQKIVNHNAHIYFLLVETEAVRTKLIEKLNERGIMAVFHYTPLHQSKAGLKQCKSFGDLENTQSQSSRLLRLPLFHEMTFEDVDLVVAEIKNFYRSIMM